MLARSTISLTDVPLFQGISPETLAPLWMTCRHVQLERHQVLFHEGDKGNEMYIIEDGEIRIWKENEDGHKLELATLGATEVVGELEIIDGKPRSANAQAVAQTRLVALQRDDFFDHLGMYPGMAVHMMVILSERLRRNNELQLQLHRQYQPTLRVAQLLYLLANAENQVAMSSEARAHMAFVLSMETESLERILQQWQQQQLIEFVDQSTLRIIDLPKAS